jgi:hypothetical protein
MQTGRLSCLMRKPHSKNLVPESSAGWSEPRGCSSAIGFAVVRSIAHSKKHGKHVSTQVQLGPLIAGYPFGVHLAGMLSRLHARVTTFARRCVTILLPWRK